MKENVDRLSNVGEEWDFDAVEILKENNRAKNDARRYSITIALLGGICLGVLVLGGYWLFTGDYRPVAGFWSATGPFFGAIIRDYFGPSGQDP